MCEFFSFAVAKNGQILAILGAERERMLSEGKNPDSHTEICSRFQVSEDEVWKFQITLDYNKWEKLCQGDNIPLSSVEELRKFYDGGLPVKDLPIELAQSAINWVCQHKDEIVQAGELRFADARLRDVVYPTDDPMKWPASFIIQLPRVYTPEQLEEALALIPTERGWGTHKVANDAIDTGVRVNLRYPVEMGNITHLAIQRWVHIYFRPDKDGNPVRYEEPRVAIIPSSVPVKV